MLSKRYWTVLVDIQGQVQELFPVNWRCHKCLPQRSYIENDHIHTISPENRSIKLMHSAKFWTGILLPGIQNSSIHNGSQLNYQRRIRSQNRCQLSWLLKSQRVQNVCFLTQRLIDTEVKHIKKLIPKILSSIFKNNKTEEYIKNHSIDVKLIQKYRWFKTIYWLCCIQLWFARFF